MEEDINKPETTITQPTKNDKPPEFSASSQSTLPIGHPKQANKLAPFITCTALTVPGLLLLYWFNSQSADSGAGYGLFLYGPIIGLSLINLPLAIIFGTFYITRSQNGGSKLVVAVICSILFLIMCLMLIAVIN